MGGSSMKEKKGLFQKFLDVVERLGNKLPDRFALFLALACLVIIISWIFSMFDASVIHPGNGEDIPISYLLCGAGLQFLLSFWLGNCSVCARLGLVLAMLLGIGLAEKVGLLDFVIRKSFFKSVTV